MEISRIRELRLNHPFVPFVLVLKDGRRLPVEKPYSLAISPKGTEMAYAMTGEGPLFLHSGDVRDIEVNGQDAGVRV